MWRGEPLFCNGSAPVDLIKFLFQDFKKCTNIYQFSCEINFLSLVALWSVIQHNLYDDRDGKVTTRVSLYHNIVPWGVMRQFNHKWILQRQFSTCLYLPIYIHMADLVWESFLGGRLWVCVQRNWDPTPACLTCHWRQRICLRIKTWIFNSACVRKCFLQFFLAAGFWNVLGDAKAAKRCKT